MEIDITQIVVALIGLLSVIITSVVVPLIKSKVTNSQWEMITKYALAGVQAAEIIIGCGNGEAKFEMVRTTSKNNVAAAQHQRFDMDTIKSRDRKRMEVFGAGLYPRR